MLNFLKTKIVLLPSHGLKRGMLDSNDPDRLVEEESSLFHILQMRKRRTVHIIRSVLDVHGNTQRSTKGIVQAFTTFLRRKYVPTVVDEECVLHITEAGWRVLPPAWGDLLEQPISLEEVSKGMRKLGGIKRQAVTGLAWNSIRRIEKLSKMTYVLC
jgi:hypothetical protein